MEPASWPPDCTRLPRCPPSPFCFRFLAPPDLACRRGRGPLSPRASPLGPRGTDSTEDEEWVRGNHGQEISPNPGILWGPPHPTRGCRLRRSGCQARSILLGMEGGCQKSGRSRAPLEEYLCPSRMPPDLGPIFSPAPVTRRVGLFLAVLCPAATPQKRLLGTA